MKLADLMFISIYVEEKKIIGLKKYSLKYLEYPPNLVNNLNLQIQTEKTPNEINPKKSMPGHIRIA